MENYINQLKKILTKTNWSQTQLAQEVGVTFATLNRWLNGHTKPHQAQLCRIDRIFKNIVGIIPLLPDVIDSIIKSVMVKKGQFENIDRFLRREEIEEEFLLELTYNSDAIEGSTLTRKETEAIIFDQATVKNKSLVEHLEATNHAAILRDIFERKFDFEITDDLIKNLHKALMQGIRKDAGEYVKHRRAIRGVDLILPHPDDIPEEIRLFCRKIDHYRYHPIEHIAKMHADFEAIHPFGDGNGCVGRLIMIIQLVNQGFAPCIIRVDQRAEYYEFLEYAQKKSETHFVQFLAEAVLKGYEIIEKYE